MDTGHLSYLGLPTALEEAVERLNDILGPDDKRTISETLEDDLVDYHFGLGLAIRNALRLHEESRALLACAEGSDAEGASEAILTALWFRLRDNPKNV